MSEQSGARPTVASAKAPNGNGRHEGMIGAAADLGATVTRALTPPYLALVLLNVGVWLTLLYFFDHARADRMVVFNRLMDVCVAKIEAGR